MKRRHPERGVVHKLEPPGRGELTELLRALDAVEPPAQWDDIVAAAVEPDAPRRRLRELEGPRRERHPLLLMVAAASVVLAIAGSVLAVSTDHRRQVVMAKLGITSPSDPEEAGPSSAPGKGAERSDDGGSSDQGSGTGGPTRDGSTKERQTGDGSVGEGADGKDGGSDGDISSGGGSDGTRPGGDGGSGRRDDDPVDPPSDGGASTEPEESEPTTSVSSPPNEPVTPPSSSPQPLPDLWGGRWVADEIADASGIIDPQASETAEEPVLDLTEAGMVRFSWCNGFTVQAEGVTGSLLTDAETFTDLPTVCDDDTGAGEAIVRDLLDADPAYALEDGRLTLLADTRRAVFVLQP